MAPTRPHEAAPESAVGNAVVGPFAALVDRARDAIRHAAWDDGTDWDADTDDKHDFVVGVEGLEPPTSAL